MLIARWLGQDDYREALWNEPCLFILLFEPCNNGSVSLSSAVWVSLQFHPVFYSLVV